MKALALILIGAVLAVSGCVGQGPAPVPGPAPEGVQFAPPAQLPPANVGVPYFFSFCQPALTDFSDLCGGINPTINPIGGNPPYSFELGSGVGFPPFGITLGLNGILSGTPSAEGTRTFEVCAKDLNGDNDCATVALAVNPAPQPPGPEPEPAPAPEPPVEVTATIDSLECDIVSTVEGADQTFYYEFEISASGTASGPVGTETWQYKLPPSSTNYVYENIDDNEATVTAGSWSITPSGTRAVRNEGQPSTTTWNYEGGYSSTSVGPYGGHPEGTAVYVYMEARSIYTIYSGNYVEDISEGIYARCV